MCFSWKSVTKLEELLEIARVLVPAQRTTVRLSTDKTVSLCTETKRGS